MSFSSEFSLDFPLIKDGVSQLKKTRVQNGFFTHPKKSSLILTRKKLSLDYIEKNPDKNESFVASFLRSIGAIFAHLFQKTTDLGN